MEPKDQAIAVRLLLRWANIGYAFSKDWDRRTLEAADALTAETVRFLGVPEPRTADTITERTPDPRCAACDGAGCNNCDARDARA